MIKMVNNKWDLILDEEYHQDYFKKIVAFINKIYKEKDIFPPKPNILRALSLTDYDDVKVVILGQDPYHGVGEANGLSFSVNKGVRIPPSLRNIYKELYDDLGITPPNHGDLTSWAKEGVLLLNSVLTVEKDKANSHSNIGWQQFTDDVIRLIDNNKRDVVFILWGNYARSKKALIKNNFIIESAHPSPFSAYNGFFGSKPFSKCNNYLKSKGLEEIKW